MHACMREREREQTLLTSCGMLFSKVCTRECVWFVCVRSSVNLLSFPLPFSQPVHLPHTHTHARTETKQAFMKDETELKDMHQSASTYLKSYDMKRQNVLREQVGERGRERECVCVIRSNRPVGQRANSHPLFSRTQVKSNRRSLSRSFLLLTPTHTYTHTHTHTHPLTGRA